MASTASNNAPLLFLIVGRNEPLYEAEFSSITNDDEEGKQQNDSTNASNTLPTSKAQSTNISSSINTTTTAGGGSGTQSDSITRQNYFVMHSSLDLIDLQSFSTPQMYLKVVDKVNHQQVSAYVTAAHVKFLLLSHTGQKSEDSIKNFFTDVYELYVKVGLFIRFYMVMYIGIIH